MNQTGMKLFSSRDKSASSYDQPKKEPFYQNRTEGEIESYGLPSRAVSERIRFQMPQ